ncbi:MAG: transporter [Gammaproteobacteria bacterium]|nr:MAG: transporter [Gammaproteobacteria bacterium]
MRSQLIHLYNHLVLRHPRSIIILTLIISTFFACYIPQFKLDASADSLVLEHDQALKYYRAIKARYGSDDFLIITYTPQLDLFSDEVIADLQQLKHKLLQLDRVDSVTSILDVPLTQSPPVSLGELSEGIRTLETEGMDRTLARKEFLSSPLYYNLIISPDASTTAIQVNLKRDEQFFTLLHQRNALREKQLTTALSHIEEAQLESVSKAFLDYSHSLQDQESQLIASVRAIMDQHRHMASMHLGGVPMIAADSIAYIQNDLQTFGLGVVAFIIVILAIAFRKPRWVLLPMLTCVLAGVIMIGLLGLLEWRVTVVSSNFISLLLIITLSLNIHLIVRHRELHARHPDHDQYSLIQQTIQSKFLPSFYTAITTMVAFVSLIVSGIRPVIDFGWMMVLGISIAFVLTFTFFPATLLLLKPGEPAFLRDITAKITGALAKFIEHYRISTLIIAAITLTLSIIGVFKITVENRFIDYYKEHTEIYQGMLLIDQELGGTTPLDVVIDAPKWFSEQEMNSSAEDALFPELELELDSETEAGITATSYWFNYNMMEQIKHMHEYLDSLPETGKVLSIYTTVSMLEQLRDNEDLNDFFLSIIYKRVPDEIRDTLIEPYMTADGNQIRISIRVIDSDKSLQREALLQEIRQHLIHEIGLEEDQVHLSGMLVLYNNMLQSLYQSQIMTIGVVFIAILAMFIILFKSIRLAVLAILPNMLSAASVLGLMGLVGIPLDMMTITIAAICIGIAVDDTIHYVHRYKEEFPIDNNYWAAVKRCHASIGRAMYYTSLIITLGFSILAMSNFNPMIYFGLLTGFAMMVALLSNLTLLPLFIALFKPTINQRFVL